MLNGILEDVEHELTQEILVASERNFRTTSRPHGDTARRRDHLDRAPALRDDVVEIQIYATQRVTAGVSARKDEHIRDQAAQTLGFAADDGECLSILLRRSALAAQRDVGGRPNDGHRRPELMRCIRHELPLRAERRAQPCKEAIERTGELPDFVGPPLSGETFNARRREVGGLARHVGNRSQSDGRQPQSSGHRDQQDDRNADEHRFLHLALLAPHVVERTGDQERHDGAIERFWPDMDAPATGSCLHRRRAGAALMQQLFWRREAAPGRREGNSTGIENRHRTPGDGHRGASLLGRRRRRHAFSELGANHIGEGGNCGIELTIDTPHPKAPLNPEHVGGAKAQHEHERQRVPEGQPQSQRQRSHAQQRWCHECSDGDNWYPSPRRVRISDSAPRRSSFRRSRCTYTSTTFDSGS